MLSIRNRKGSDAVHLDNSMKISIGIIALNEEVCLPYLLEDILEQKYDKKNIELILVDSGSTDKTLQIFYEFKNKFSNMFNSISIYFNYKGLQASGWNVVIQNYSLDALIRLDAHSRIPSDFIQQNVMFLNKGENVVGGLRTVINSCDTKWNKTLWLAEMSLFGSSIANYRHAESERYVNSMFHACYRREVLNKVGFFNEKLGRTEDNEFHYRVRQAGYKLFYTPKIKSYQLIRSNLYGMIKQKYSNGYWIGKTIYYCPRCLEYFHFVPFLFVLSLIISLIMFVFSFKIFLRILLGLYFAFDVLNTILCTKSSKFNYTSIMLLLIFPLLHVSYGFGTIFGLLSGGINE